MDTSGLSRLFPEVAVLVIVLWYMSKKDKLFTDTNNKLADSVAKNAEAIKENTEFMRNLNGELKKVVRKKLIK